jgi:hypothetical protein
VSCRQARMCPRPVSRSSSTGVSSRPTRASTATSWSTASAPGTGCACR